MRLDYQKQLWRFCESPWILSGNYLFLGNFHHQNPSRSECTQIFYPGKATTRAPENDSWKTTLSFWEVAFEGLSLFNFAGAGKAPKKGWGLVLPQSKKFFLTCKWGFRGVQVGKCWRWIVSSLHDFHPTSDDSGRRYFRESQVQSLRNTIEINRVSKFSDVDFVGWYHLSPHDRPWFWDIPTFT